MKKSKMKKTFSETFKKVAGTEDKRKQGKHTGDLAQKIPFAAKYLVTQ